jgi:hypothetical protein
MARRVPAALFTCLLLAAPAVAGDSPAALDLAFSNTVVSTYPDGRTAKLWLEPGGTYRGQGRKGQLSSGKWSIKGERICLRQHRPVFVPTTYCTSLVNGGVGTTWSGKAVTGEPVRMELVAGR